MTTAVNIYGKYAKDQNLEMVEGAKFYIDKENDSYIRVLRLTGRNKGWLKANAELAKKSEQLTEDEMENERSKIFIKYFVVGWNNIADQNGNELAFSPNVAETVLMDLPDLFEELFTFAMNGDNYKVENVAKN